MARYAYEWAIREKPALQKIVPPTSSRQKTGFIVTENDEGVMIEFEKFMVLIKPK